MSVTRRFKHVESVGQSDDIDRLPAQLRQLASHRGFDRGRVSSPLLKRLLPATAAARLTFTEAVARTALRQAQLDPKSIGYLIQNVRDELAAAHAALA